MRSIKDGSIGYSNFLIQHRFIVFLLVLLCTVGLCIPLANMGVEMDNRPERFAPAGDSSFSDLAEMHKEFGRDDYFVLLVKGDVWSPTFLESVEELHKDLMKLEQPPDLIWSLYNAPIFMEVDGRRKLVRIGKDVQKTTELQKGSAHLEGKLVNKDGTWSTIWCQAPVLSEKESAEYFQMLEGMVTERSKEGFSILLGDLLSYL
jgi:predicted RND superfamily exporter protein